MLTSTEQKQLAKDLKKVLQAHYGTRLNKLVLFGSYVRGDYHEDSDIDFLIVFNDTKINSIKEIINIAALKNNFILDYNINISSIPMEKKRFETEHSPFLSAVRKEGMPI